MSMGACRIPIIHETARSITLILHKKAFAGNSIQHSLHNRNALKEQNISYVQLSTKIKKLEKSNNKIKKK